MTQLHAIPAPPESGLHEESLARIPLVRRMLQDPLVKLSRRAIDQRWYYERVIPGNLAGFNPFLGTIFYAQGSALSRWLADPYGSARNYNEGDHLVREVLFAVHDYLHSWSAAVISALAPEVRFREGPILRHNIEDFVFCQLLTEAAATVGLDYWYLSTLFLDELVPMGTAISTLTVDYHERHLSEYRRFCPNWEAQHPGFFEDLAKFYCSGIFEGFDVKDLRRSARLLTWLSHELSYGSTQREYTRLWFSSMAAEEISYERGQLSTPLSVEEDWKQRLLHELGLALWAKVKEDHDSGLRLAPPEAPPTTPEERRPDFRFVNANVADPAPGEALGPESMRYFVMQRVAAASFDGTPDEVRHRLGCAFRRGEYDTVLRLSSQAERVPSEPDEPRDLFLLS